MKKLLFVTVVLSFFCVQLLCQESTPKDTAIFEATVVRVEPWGLIKIS